MYRSRGPAIGGPSKATAATTCQKCLKKDIYECKAVIQERPYVSRPSRTQQLLNPKLVPKLTSDVPQDLVNKKGVADEQLAKLDEERGRKRDRMSEDLDTRGASKRMRSASSVSSASVSTISTSMSRSPSPRPAVQEPSAHRRFQASPSPPRPGESRRSRPSRMSPSPPPQQSFTDSERKRRRESFSSAGSYSSESRGSMARDERERVSSRSTRRKYRELSPEVRGRRTESRSPARYGRRRHSNDRRRVDEWDKPNRSNRESLRSNHDENKGPPRERSLSPFSKRLALTQAMNMGR